jgi:hypothetical protein
MSRITQPSIGHGSTERVCSFAQDPTWEAEADDSTTYDRTTCIEEAPHGDDRR